MTDQARAAYEALQACRAACDRILDQYNGVTAGVDWPALSRTINKALAAHETQSTLHNAACDVPGLRNVPAGFVMVPVEPTPEMLRAGSHSVNMNYHYGTPESIARHAHAAMLAAAPAQPAAGLVGLTEQHDRDSAELRRLCQARDDARRERDLARVEAAGLEASVGNLGRLVDELRPDAERLEWVLRRVSGSWLRAYVGHVGDTGNMDTLRTLIDANRGALESETAHPKEQTP